MDTTTQPETPPEAQPASVWEDLVDIFYDPATVFARRQDGRYASALFIVTGLMTVLFHASQTVLVEAMRADFARDVEGQLTAEQMEAMEYMSSAVFGTVGFLITFPIGVLLGALALWLLAKVFGSVASYAAAAMVVTFAQAPKILQQVAAVIQGLVMEPMDSLYRVTFSPARFMDPEVTSATVIGLLGRLDLFVIWSTVLMGIGISAVGGLPRSQGYLVAGLIWLLGVIPIVGGAVF